MSSHLAGDKCVASPEADTRQRPGGGAPSVWWRTPDPGASDTDARSLGRCHKPSGQEDIRETDVRDLKEVRRCFCLPDQCQCHGPSGQEVTREADGAETEDTQGPGPVASEAEIVAGGQLSNDFSFCGLAWPQPPTIMMEEINSVYLLTMRTINIEW